MNRDLHLKKCCAIMVLFYCLFLQAVYGDAPQGLHLQKQREVLLHQGRLTSMACSPGGNLIAGSAADGTIYLWDREGRLMNRYAGGEDKSVPVVALAFSPDEKRLVIAPDQGFLQIVNIGEKAPPRSIKWLESPCSLAVSPDGTRLAVGTRSGDILMWDMASRRLLRILDGHTYFVTALAFNERGDFLASGSWDRTVRLWNVHTGKTERVLWGPDERPPLLFPMLRGSSPAEESKDSINQPVISLAVCGNELARGGLNGSIVIWDVSSGEISRKIKGDAGEASSLAFAPLEHILACGYGSGAIGLWDPATGGEPTILKGHKASVKFIRFLCQERGFISGSLDGTLCFWIYSTR